MMNGMMSETVATLLNDITDTEEKIVMTLESPEGVIKCKVDVTTTTTQDHCVDITLIVLNLINYWSEE